jgi:hypothetical protein
MYPYDFVRIADESILLLPSFSPSHFEGEPAGLPYYNIHSQFEKPQYDSRDWEVEMSCVNATAVVSHAFDAVEAYRARLLVSENDAETITRAEVGRRMVDTDCFTAFTTATQIAWNSTIHRRRC